MKQIRNLLIVISVALFLSAATAQIEIPFALHTTPPGPDHEAVERFAELVAERSGGQLIVITYPGGVLGGEIDNIQQLKVGEIALSIHGDLLPSMLAARFAPHVVPFVFRSAEGAMAYWDTEVGQQLREAIENQGIIVVGMQRRGDRHLTANRAVTTPADVRGIRLRVPEIGSWVKAWSEVGARPTPVAWPEVFSALQTGVVEAQENPCISIYQARLYEVQSYLIMTAHLPNLFHWAASTRFLDRLTPEQRQIIIEAAAEASRYGDQVAQEQIAAFCQALVEEHGMELIEPDREAFWQAAHPAIQRLAETTWAPGVLDTVNELNQRYATP